MVIKKNKKKQNIARNLRHKQENKIFFLNGKRSN